jgi:HK97 family phage prohead protease
MPEQTVYRDALDRSVAFTLRDGGGEGDSDGLTIDGMAAVYDTPTRIDSWEGRFDESIAYGAFGRSIRAKLPRMQYDHGRHPMIGTIPIGRWDSAVEEKAAGLHLVGRMHDNWLIEPVRQAIAEQSVDGMSIRMTVVRDEWRDIAGKVVRDPKEIAELLWNPGDRGPLQRTIREAKIAEAGPVCWPAYETTSVGVRSTVTIDLARLDTDPEQRRLLAQAVLLADTASSTTDGPRSTEQPPDLHPPTGGPQVTGTPPGEHPSAPPRAKPNPARAFAARTRGYLLSIEGK